MPSLPTLSLLSSSSLGVASEQLLMGLLQGGCPGCPLAGTAHWGPQALEKLSPGSWHQGWVLPLTPSGHPPHADVLRCSGRKPWVTGPVPKRHGDTKAVCHGVAAVGLGTRGEQREGSGHPSAGTGHGADVAPGQQLLPIPGPRCGHWHREMWLCSSKPRGRMRPSRSRDGSQEGTFPCAARVETGLLLNRAQLGLARPEKLQETSESCWGWGVGRGQVAGGRKVVWGSGLKRAGSLQGHAAASCPP